MRSPQLLRALTVVFLLTLASLGQAEEVIPPKPDRYFNDYASVVPRDLANRLNEELAQFERDTSNQVLVAVYPKMQTDSDIADYTRRVAQSWGVGQKERNNGVVLFVFTSDRKMFIQTGYGTEGAIPDAIAFDITERRMKPRFRTGDYGAGLAMGVRSIEQALKGEYKGTGRTNLESNRTNRPQVPFVVILIFFVIFFILMVRSAARQNRRGYGYSRRGGPFMGGWMGSGGGGSSDSGGGGWSSGGGGFSGFSGGGGGFGGGGAGSSW